MADEDQAPQTPDPQAEGPAPEAQPNLQTDGAVEVSPDEAAVKQAEAVDALTTVDPDAPSQPVFNEPVDPDVALDNPEAWTVQSPHALVRPEGRPGNVVTKAELPNLEALKEAGIDVEQYLAGLVVAADDEARNFIQSAEAAWKARVRAKEAAKDGGVQPVEDSTKE